ncbi:MAG: hypothetical protein K0R83_972 [Caulobacter sp.]|jgi:hypothetical protein|nr:hypothetical protein [Caulobacter sp.]
MRIACGPLVIDETTADLVVVGAEFVDGSGYLLVQLPGDGNQEDWFGADHYVEVSDQSHGQFGGIKTLEVHKDSLVFTLSGASDLFGEPIELVFSEPMVDEAVNKLSRIGSAN